MYCRNCGKQMPDGANYCSSCGTYVGEISFPRQSNQPRKRSGRKIWILVGVCVAICVGSVTALFFPKDKETISKKEYVSDETEMDSEIDDIPKDKENNSDEETQENAQLVLTGYKIIEYDRYDEKESTISYIYDWWEYEYDTQGNKIKAVRYNEDGSI